MDTVDSATSSEQAAQNSTFQPGAPSARRTLRPQVLLADDSETVRNLLATLLRRMGCDVDAVEHGEQALGLARHVRYDLVLLDLDMPLMDGMATAREIRSLHGGANTPIMAVSAFLGGIGDPGERSKLFDGEIAKPVTSEQLRQVLLNAWPTRSVAVRDPNHRDQPLPLVDMAILHAIRLRTGSQTSSSAIVTAMAEMRSCAGRLQLAVSRDDRGPVKQAAHNLRRVALSCGAARLARRATVLLAAANGAHAPELRKHAGEIVGCVAATVAELKKFADEND